MRSIVLTITVIFAAQCGSAFADDKAAGLSDTLTIVDVQGGFAGFTGWKYTIKKDGSWSREQVFNRRLTPKAKGKLNEKQLASIAAALKKASFAKLPARIGKPIGANPHNVTLTYGKKTVNVTGQPGAQFKPGEKTPEGRIGIILAAVKSVAGRKAAPASK